MNPNKKKRNHRIALRLTDVEQDYMLKKMQECDYTTISNFIRDCIYNTTVITIDRSKFRLFAFEVNRIGNNLNQVTKKLNQQGQADDQIKEEIRSVVKKLNDFVVENTDNSYEKYASKNRILSEEI